MGGKMSRRRLLWIVMLVLPLVLGMGSRSNDSPEKIPAPLKKFRASFIDQMDVLTQCTNVSIDGETYLQGKRGEGNYTIGFDRIASVVLHLSGGKLIGVVKLRDGTSLELILNGSQKAYGFTGYGTFQIRLQDLKKMTIGGKG
jgi:hypothetical protein